MLQAILIIALSLVPVVLSVVVVGRALRKLRMRLRNARSVTSWRPHSGRVRSQWQDLGVGTYAIGDPSCAYNARSPYIRCAVNPDGPCENCNLYEPRGQDK